METSPTTILITAFPRLHLSLIAMNRSGYRINGGIGLSIQDPKIEVKVTENDLFTVKDERSTIFPLPLSERLKMSIDNAVNVKKFKKNIAVELTGSMLSNSGFGSGTIIRLACMEALHIVNQCPFTNDQLIELSGRGGTSGIGIRTYFQGGFVFDIGHKEIHEILPSSSKESIKKQSLIIDSGQAPDWEIGICIPKDLKPLTEKEEIDFFTKSIPISDVQVNMTLYHVIYGVLASLKENDIETFSKSVKEIQKCRWKQLERDIYGNKLLEYEDVLYRSGASAVGMSSLGPSLYFVSKDVGTVIKLVEQTSEAVNLILLKTRTANNGRIINLC